MVGLSDYIDHPDLEIIRADIIHHDAIDDLLVGISSVIHLSGLSNDPSCDLDPNLTIRSNFLSTLSIARRAKQEGVKRFIFASSCSVYGAQGEDIINEESKTGPVTLYALTKLECERELSRLSSDDFVISTPRLATLFGYSKRMRFDLAVNIMCKRAISGQGLIVNGDGKQFRPFLHVEDASDAFINLLEAPKELVNSIIYNIGRNENNYQIIDLAKAVAAHFEGTELKQVAENKDVRSYRVSFDKYQQAFQKGPNKSVPYAFEEIQDAVNKGLLNNMDEINHYNLLVMKSLNQKLELPNLALPSLNSSSRWSVLNESEENKENIQNQMNTSLDQ